MELTVQQAIRVMTALKPLNDYLTAYYREDGSFFDKSPSEIIIAEKGDAVITLQHCINARDTLESLGLLDVAT